MDIAQNMPMPKTMYENEVLARGSAKSPRKPTDEPLKIAQINSQIVSKQALTYQSKSTTFISHDKCKHQPDRLAGWDYVVQVRL
jgi:hypothetical protein